VGTAPKAAFYLFRSEDASTEYLVEEHNWVCAAERVDSVGGDLISSSLGYNLFDNAAFNHTYADMNGNTTMAATGADLAARKGIMVVNSAGNEGNNTWKFIVTPADGDSVLAVGAVSATGAVASFSSYGPSSDGQVKPDLASVGLGTLVQYPDNTLGPNNGTSFAAPNLAGLVTCLWQGFPEFNNIRVLNALRASGNIAGTPNDRIGFGIRDMKKATMILLKAFATSAAASANCRATLTWASKDVSAMRYDIERKLPGQNTFMKIAERPGTGSVFSTRNYQFDDDLTEVAQGQISYRIRQVIDTSAAGFFADYIDTASLILNTNCISGSNSVTVMPNPTRGSTVVRVSTPNASERLTLQLYNSKGQLVKEIRTSKPAGLSFFEISLYPFASGKYYLRVYQDETLVETKELLRL
jgi:serine protease AprX